jgi:translation initiation factor 2B subunit (eIF-2B alpha/beta/delta family)
VLNSEIIDENEKLFTTKLNANKLNIINCEKKVIVLKDKIVIKRQEIKNIKIHINKLEYKLEKEKQESRKFREALFIFLSREKFKKIKRLIIKRYRIVFFKFSSDASIKTEIVECNDRKEKIREEKQAFDNSMEICNKKINMIKKSLSENRKKIITTRKSNKFIVLKLQKLKNYKENEKKLRLEIIKYEK